MAVSDTVPAPGCRDKDHAGWTEQSPPADLPTRSTLAAPRGFLNGLFRTVRFRHMPAPARWVCLYFSVGYRHRRAWWIATAIVAGISILRFAHDQFDFLLWRLRLPMDPYPSVARASLRSAQGLFR